MDIPEIEEEWININANESINADVAEGDSPILAE